MKTSRLFACITLISILSSCNRLTPQQAPPLIDKSTQSLTATPSATAPAPTATQEATVPDSNASAYRLANQTADSANETLVRIEQAILNLQNMPVPDDALSPEPDYESYYRAAWYAAEDALVHFPDDPRADLWHWKIPYYMTLAGDSSDASKIYADKIQSALNSNEINPDELEGWFHSGELESSIYTQHYTLKKSPITIKGNTTGFLIELGRLDDIDTPGGMCLLITKNANQFTSYVVYDGFDGVYDWMERNPITCSPKDVTDDGTDEIIVNQYTGGHYGSTSIQVIDISSLPPKTMPFTPSNEQTSEVWNGDIQGYSIKNGKTQIEIYAPVGDLNCENYYNNFYQWNGKWFELSNQIFHFGTPYDNSATIFCVDMALSNLYSLNPKDSANFLDQAIQAYLPRANDMGDVYHELMIQKAVSYAFAGEQSKARSTLTEMVQTPVIKDSIWIEPAQKFLDIYKKPSDLYQACSMLNTCAAYRAEDSSYACIDTNLCYPFEALYYLLNAEYSAIPLDKLVPELKNNNIEIAADGYFDFNQDEKKELWFTVPDTDGNPDLWVVMEDSKGKNVAFNIGYYESALPQPTFQIETTPSGQGLVDFGEYDGLKFELTLDSTTGEPLITWVDPSDTPEVPDEIEQTIKLDLKKFKELRESLLAGIKTEQVYADLMNLSGKYQSCPFEFEHSDGSTTTYYDCASFYYTLAFTADLAGKSDEAIKGYHKVWSEYPGSAFAILARFKLEK